MEPVPHDQKILTRIDRDEKERERDRERGESRPPTSTPSSSSLSTTTTTKSAMEGGSEREREEGGKSGGGGEVSTDCKMAVCFMDHITKAVERSFSSITEEEERKEKEKVSANIERRQTGKTIQWGAAVMKALPVWNHWSFTWFLFPVVLFFSLLFFSIFCLSSFESFKMCFLSHIFLKPPYVFTVHGVSNVVNGPGQWQLGCYYVWKII
jgi:hypothetical protein